MTEGKMCCVCLATLANWVLVKYEPPRGYSGEAYVCLQCIRGLQKAAVEKMGKATVR